MQDKLQELTEKIYTEGVTKGKEEADGIVSNAKTEAEKIIADAKKQAENIIAEAEKKGEESKANTKSELNLAGKQIISGIKQNITTLIAGELVKIPVKEAVADKDFLKTIIIKIVENWNSSSASDLSLILPEKNQKDLDAYFKKSADELLKKGINIKYAEGIKSGFQIEPSEGGFKISFSEEEFENYFKAYLRPKLVELLFGE